jgi:cob(I)alamin adenosyltransferase
MVHIDKVYTRGGDAGLTSVGDGSRVPKTHPRIRASGSVDEVNCVLGTAAAAAGVSPELEQTLRELQQFLFDLGADLTVPLPEDAASDTCPRTTADHVARMEEMIDRFSARLQPLQSFILPGGAPAAAALHLARAVCRRAELDVLELRQVAELNPQLTIALNRLSDLLFVLARIANDDGRTDVLWQPGGALQSGS